MSLELWNTFGTFGTFLVIAGTAVAALVQLRHMRGSNQIAALSDLFEKERTSEYVAARQFVFSGLPEKMKDPAFRRQIVNSATQTGENAELIAKILATGSYYEEMGIFAKFGLVDCNLLFDMHAGNIVMAWDALSDVTALRREHQSPLVYENFKYVTVLAQDWMAKHTSGTYPPNVRRLDLPSRWRSGGVPLTSNVQHP